jgi:hypothetical protein
MRPDIASHPVGWLIYFPIGLIMVALMSFIIFISWPLYIVYRIGKWTVYMFGDEI